MPDIFDSSQQNNALPEVPPADTSADTFEAHKQNAFAKLSQGLGISSNPFSSFAAQPKNTSLDIQMEDEEVLLLMRKHPVTQIKWIVAGIVLILLPILFGYVPLLNFLPSHLQTVALIGWYLIVASFCLEAFLNWFYNIYIVTNERVIDVDFHSLLFKNIASAHLDKIEDISVTNKGYAGSVFDYGTVLIQTAGALDQFEFEEAPHPSRVSAFINELIMKEEKENRTIIHT